FPKRRHPFRGILLQESPQLYLREYVAADHRLGLIPNYAAGQWRKCESLRRGTEPGGPARFPTPNSARIFDVCELHTCAFGRDASARELHPAGAGEEHGERVARL